jgi:glycosyltransferase involved in cell wall biosynthesis
MGLGMKLFLDCSLLSIGGGVQVGLSIIQNIANDSSFQLIVTASPQINEQLNDDVKNKLFAYHVVENVSIFKKIKQGKLLAELEERYNPDLVFCVFGPCYWQPKANFLQGFALPKMLYPESRKNYTKKSYKFKEELIDYFKAYFFKKNSKHVVVETDVFKDRLLQKFNLDSRYVYVIPNSYSPAFQKSIKDNLASINPNENEINIFVPGGYYRHKNYEVLPEIASQLLINNRNKNFCFYLSLNPESTGWLNIQKIAIDLGVLEHIKTLGHIPNAEIGKEYLRSNIIMSLSSAEASTAVYPEAMCAKRPLIVSDTDFARKLCKEAALYVNPFNAKEIAEKIIYLSNNESLRINLIENGDKVFISNYPDPDSKWKMQRELLIKLANLN